ncbi:MAG: metal-dependent transcriptional regulator, partial [Halobacteriaceae archaeon]
GFGIEEVHDEADALEHHISEDFERRVATVLDDPQTDPHGDPIPSADLEPPAEETTISLAECEAGTTVRVVRLRDRNGEELAYLSEVGIEPGVELDVVEWAPIGLVTVSRNDEKQALPERVAAAIRVRKLDTSSEDEEVVQ